MNYFWSLGVGDNFNASAVPATDVIVIGASAGGLGAVRTLLSMFPESVPAAIFVVINTSPDSPGLLGAASIHSSARPQNPLARARSVSCCQETWPMGTHGLMVIKRAGGVTIVQDPDQAEVNQMPLNAMRRVGVDYVLSLRALLLSPRGADHRAHGRKRKIDAQKAG